MDTVIESIGIVEDESSFFGSSNDGDGAVVTSDGCCSVVLFVCIVVEEVGKIVFDNRDNFVTFSPTVPTGSSGSAGGCVDVDNSAGVGADDDIDSTSPVPVSTFFVLSATVTEVVSVASEIVEVAASVISITEVFESAITGIAVVVSSLPSFSCSSVLINSTFFVSSFVWRASALSSVAMFCSLSFSFSCSRCCCCCSSSRCCCSCSCCSCFCSRSSL